MANTQALKRRIKTAQNISKTTKAFQMIAASRLRRAQNAVLASRPYVTKLTEISRNLASDVDFTEGSNAYFKTNKNMTKNLYIIISPDKGLCGGLIANLVREYLKINKKTDDLFITVGKKIEGTVAGSTKNLVASFPFGLTLPSFEMISPIKTLIDEYYLTGKVGAVKIITTKFNSVFSQKPIVLDLLPLAIESSEKNDTLEESNIKLFEPSKDILLSEVAKRFIEMTLFQNLLESYASEQAARMVAMQNSTDNANDMVSSLRLLYNKARQEKITKEILDITSAAVALAAE